MPWVDPPPASGRLVDPARFDAVWSALRDARVHAIRTRELEGPAFHRGGFGLSVRWSGGECHIDDFGTSEVDERDDERFRAAIEAVAKAHDESPPFGTLSP